jgi:hypothetical protein
MLDNDDIPPPLAAPAGYTPPTPRAEHETAPDGPTCQHCGAGPAAHATFRQNTGMLFGRTAQAIDGTFCRSCGLALGRVMANRTLWTGWWGIISCFVNIGYVVANAGRLLKHGTLGKPRGGQGTLDPGRPMLLRSGVLVLVALICVGVAIADSSSSNSSASSDSGYDSDYDSGGYIPPVDVDDVPSVPQSVTPPPPPAPTWQAGACVSVTGDIAEPVPCTDAHQGTVLTVAADESACPLETDGTVTHEGVTYCVDTG